MADTKTTLIEQLMQNIKALESVICQFKTDLSSNDIAMLTNACVASEVLCAYITTTLCDDILLMYKHYNNKFHVDTSVAH